MPLPSPQVSNQCMALVRDNCLVPTIDDPSLGYVKESSSEQYVPDVFYKVSFSFTILSYSKCNVFDDTIQL